MIDVMLDPDGTLDLNLGVLVVIRSPTGVTYRTQCGGYACLAKSVEGLIIPVAGPETAKRIYDWFWSSFHGWCCNGRSDWTAEWTQQLRELVAEIPVWYSQDGKDERGLLLLDDERLDDCSEAWIPVQTKYGPGVMVLANSD
jgi:hypothetical protein